MTLTIQRLECDFASLLYYVLHGSRHQNCSGCAPFPQAYMDHDLKWTGTTKFRDAIKRLQAADLILYDEATEEIFISNWFETNPPTNSFHFKGIQNQINKIKSPNLKQAVKERFEAAALRKGMTEESVTADLAGRALARQRVSAIAPRLPLTRPS